MGSGDWKSDELTALHREVMEAASRAAADGAVWAAVAQAGTVISTQGGVTNTLGASAIGYNSAGSAGSTAIAAGGGKRSFVGPLLVGLIVLLFIGLGVFDGRSPRPQPTPLQPQSTSLPQQPTSPQPQQTNDTAIQEADLYRTARGNVDLLTAYLRGCQICAYASSARSEIAELRRAALTQQEEESYRAARGNVNALRKYMNDCQICAFVKEAKDDIATLEQPKVEFTIINNTSATINVAFYDGGNREPIDPSNGQVYVQNGQSRLTYAIKCAPAQNVCYGAVEQGSALNPYWGVGFEGKQGCTGCCLLCPGGAASVNLNASEANRPSPAMTWHIIANTSEQLSIAFYAENRNQWGWPAWDHNWTVSEHETTFTFSCQAGEKVCYGAWPLGNINGPYWGVGAYSKYGCTDCCALCDGGTHNVSLRD